ncbi:MAG: hypothetical protein ACTTKL_01405 [Treponema sp.]
MKKIFVLSLCLFLSAEVSVQASGKFRDFQKLYFEAQIAFDAQDFGQALKLIELSKKARKERVDWELMTLKNSFKPAEVKYAGDSLVTIKSVLWGKQDYDAINIIDSYLRFYGTERFEDSARKLLAFIETQYPYPEADFMAGRIYRLEGEYAFAHKFYSQAYKDAAVLDVPDEKYDILYALADNARVQKKYEDYEKYLLLAVGLGDDYKNNTLLEAMVNTIQSPRADCMDKFFMLYRADNFRLLKAYYELAEYYSRAGDRLKTLRTAALCSLTGFSKVYSIVQMRNPQFVFTDIRALLKEAASYDDIVDWGVDNNVWKGFNFFAEECFKNGCPVFAVKLYSVLKDYSPESYWKEEAAVRLAAISVDE